MLFETTIDLKKNKKKNTEMFTLVQLVVKLRSINISFTVPLYLLRLRFQQK